MPYLSHESCFWADTIEGFQKAEEKELIEALRAGNRRICFQEASEGQLRAWKNSIHVLRSIVFNLPSRFHIIFEFVLPRERGRRPDILILSRQNVYVLEFKDSQRIGRAYIDQVDAYARDLAEYHAGSREKRVVPILVMAQLRGLKKNENGILVYSPDTLTTDFTNIVDISDKPASLNAFLEGDYAPLPSLVLLGALNICIKLPLHS